MRTKKIETASLLFAIFLSSVVITGCKKEIQSEANEISASSSSSSNSSDERVLSTIVHAGQSIQSAVNAAGPGTVIRIEPGTYNEAIVVNKANMQLIGTGDGVIIQNPGDAENGVYLTHVDNFQLSHVTAINNGEYGLFPVFCTGGIIEHCTASGHTDTGIYVGQSSNVEMNFNA